MDVNVLPTHAEVGFWFAALVISIAWSVDWRHYVRYWIRSTRQYRRTIQLGFRVFFALCVIVSIAELIDAVADQRLPHDELAKSGALAVLILAIFFSFDAFARKRWGKPKLSDDPAVPGNLRKE